MAGMSDYLENKILDHILGATAYTPPSKVYLALYTATPSDAGGGTEVSGGDYARCEITNNTTNWPNAANGSKASGAAFTFATATASWGTITHFGLFDAPISGNLLYWNQLTASKAIDTGDTAQFASGAITVTQD